MASKAPIHKVKAGGLTGAVATVLVWWADSIPGVDVPAIVAAAITTLATAGTAYLARSAPGEASPAPVPEQSRNLFDPGPIDD